jgi:hypothetical protein
MMREIREQISREMDGMTFEEQRRWIQEQLAMSDTPPVGSFGVGGRYPAEEIPDGR